MSFEQAIETVASNLNPIDFGASFFAGAVQKPWNAAVQLSGDRLPAMHLVSEDCTTLAGQAGNIAGFAADMLLLSRLTGKLASPLVKGPISPLGSALKLGMDGAIYGGFFTASDPNSSLLNGRLENAAINGVTFAAMGGVGHMLGDAALFGPASLKSNILEGALSGGVGGVAHSFARAGIQDQSLPTLGEVAGDTASYSAFGAFFGAGHHWLNKWATRRAGAELQREPGSDRPSTPAEMQKLTTEMAGKASQRIGSWYGLLEPRLAMHLTDPNVVLTLADARGHTEFYVDNPRPLDAAAFQSLNATTEPQGIRFRTTPINDEAGGQPTLMVGVQSLAGYERCINSSNLPGIVRFNASEGFAGLAEWESRTLNSLQAAKNFGLYPEITDFSSLTHIQYGVIKGYPDEAVLACCTRTHAPDSPPMASTAIPHADHYLCAEPNYDYNIKDQNRIDLHVNEWAAVLQKYYESAWHRSLAADPSFNDCRQQHFNNTIAGWKRQGFYIEPRYYENAQRYLSDAGNGRME